MRNDLNNVDIDRQMVELAETTISYNALTQLTSAKLALLKAAINGGR
jgi:flagellar basal-body rod protein FlgB